MNTLETYLNRACKNTSLLNQLESFRKDFLIPSIYDKNENTVTLYIDGISSVIYCYNEDCYIVKDGHDSVIIFGKSNITKVLDAWEDLGYKV